MSRVRIFFCVTLHFQLSFAIIRTLYKFYLHLFLEGGGAGAEDFASSDWFDFFFKRLVRGPRADRGCFVYARPGSLWKRLPSCGLDTRRILLLDVSINQCSVLYAMASPVLLRIRRIFVSFKRFRARKAVSRVYDYMLQHADFPPFVSSVCCVKYPLNLPSPPSSRPSDPVFVFCLLGRGLRGGEQALDVVSKMLAYDPLKRIKPLEVCSHEFVDEVCVPYILVGR